MQIISADGYRFTQAITISINTQSISIVSTKEEIEGDVFGDNSIQLLENVINAAGILIDGSAD